MSFANLLYMVDQKPLPSKFENRLEIFNEATLYYASFCFILFCNVDYSQEIMDRIGMGLIGLVVFNITVNLVTTIL